MIQREAQNTMVTNNSNESSSFSIDVSSGKAYQILADGIYRYKIAAIVRELMANCHDAHVEAGRSDVAFRVKRPTAVNPVVEFEDFGTGLGDENIHKVYTSFFTSTKGGSNEVIGALGLGSKTPLAYTTGFSVRDRKDGVESTYTVYKGDDGIPKVTLQNSTPTTECNGICVSIPVKSNDFREFDEYIHFYSQFYPVMPDIAPRSEGYHDGLRDSIDRESAFSLVQTNLYTPELYTHTALALMGAVPYPISVKREKLTETEYEIYRHLDRMGSVMFHFDIGDLDISASRESLSEDPQTMEVLYRKIKQALSNERQKYEDVFNGINTVSALYSFWRRDDISRVMLREKAANGELAAKNLGVFDHPQKFEQIPKVLERINRKRDLYDSRVFRSGSEVKRYRPYERYSYLRHEHFLDGGGLTIIEADRKTVSGIVKVSKEYAERNPNRVVICLRKPLRQSLKDHLLNELSHIDVKVIPFSELKAKAPKNVTVKKQQDQLTACSFINTVYNGSQVITVDDPSRFLYADRWHDSTDRLGVGGFTHNILDMDDLPHILTAFYDKNTVVLLRNSSNASKIERMGIKSLNNSLEELRESHDLSEGSELQKYIRRYLLTSSRSDGVFQRDHMRIAKRFNEYVDIGVPEASVYLHSTVNTYGPVENPAVFCRGLMSLYDSAVTDLVIEERDRLEDEIEKIHQKYPMFDLTNADESDKIAYVNMVNQIEGDKA